MNVCERCGSEKDEEGICRVCEADEKAKLFYKTKLDKAGEVKPDIITVRFNAEERARLELIKKCLDIPSDSSALKELAFLGFNVIQRTFDADFLKWVCDKNRVRLSDK